MSLRTERDRETDSKLPTDLEDVEANKKDTCSVGWSFCQFLSVAKPQRFRHSVDFCLLEFREL